MIFPALPELPNASLPAISVKQQLLGIRRSLELACREIDGHIRSLELKQGPENECMLSPLTSSCLFEIPPQSFEQIAPEEMKSDPGMTETRLVMEAKAPTALDPLLEQATLEELNSALSKAFVQMAGRDRW
ncbi:MAG: hypothetical protein ABL974_18690 [Prosthecobacter sp.]